MRGSCECPVSAPDARGLGGVRVDVFEGVYNASDDALSTLACTLVFTAILE